MSYVAVSDVNAADLNKFAQAFRDARQIRQVRSVTLFGAVP